MHSIVAYLEGYFVVQNVTLCMGIIKKIKFIKVYGNNPLSKVLKMFKRM